MLLFATLRGYVDDVSFADGIADDPITALSVVSTVFPIVRGSRFAYPRAPTDPRWVSRKLVGERGRRKRRAVA